MGRKLVFRISRSRFFRGFVLILVGTVLSLSTLLGEDSNPNPSNTESSSRQTLREQTIYVPYEKLRRVFEQPERGVFLPYEEFQTLWNAAKLSEKKPPVPVELPVKSILSEAFYSAKISEGIVDVEATLSLTLLQTGWHEIPLRLGDVAITRAQIGEEPARLLGEPGKGYRLLLEKKDSGKPDEKTGTVQPLNIELKLRFAKNIEKTPGRNTVSFDVPQAPISRWKVVVPESGIKIDFFPLIAASEEDAGESGSTAAKGSEGESVLEKTKKETVLLAFAGPAPQVRIGWTPKTEDAAGLEALTDVQLWESVSVGESVLLTSARLDYTISRSSVPSVSIRVPNDQKVVSVFDPNVKKWSIRQENEGQIVQVELFESARNRQTLVLELEKMLNRRAESSKKQVSVRVPVLEAVGVDRQQGVLAVHLTDGLLLENVKTTGLLRMDASELPESLRQAGKKWDVAYRMSSAAYDLELTVNEVEPQITTSSQIALQISSDRLRLDMLTAFQIDRAGVFKFEFAIPADFEVRSVVGTEEPSPGFVKAKVDSFHVGSVSTDGKTKSLSVNLSGKAIGKIGLKIGMERKLSEPDLLFPTGKPVELTISVPNIDPKTVLRAEGKMLVKTSDAFRVNQTAAEGVQAVSVQQIVDPVWRLGTDDARLGFFLAGEPGNLVFQVERRKPRLTVREVWTVRVDDGLIKYNVKFYYDVLFSGIKSLRINVPQSISGRILRGGTENWRESKLVPQPDDVKPNYVAWEYSKENDLLGSGVLELSWEDELKQLEIGKSVPIEIPKLVPVRQQPTDRVWGQIVLSKSQGIDLGDSGNSEDSKGLKPIDPQYDLPPQNRIADAAAAFEFHDDWTLKLVATRYKLEEVKRTSIERGLVRANLIFSTLGTDVSAQGMYRIRSVQQRLEIKMPLLSKIRNARINGQNVGLESTDMMDRYMIPLTSIPPDTPFSLEIQYDLPSRSGTGYFPLEIPSFPGDKDDDDWKSKPSIQQTCLAVYVPDDWALVGFNPPKLMDIPRLPWTKHFEFEWSGGAFESIPVYNTQNIDSILADIAPNRSNDFVVSGTPYLFSVGNVNYPVSITPTISLLVAGETGLNVVPFLVVILIGLGLMKSTWEKRFRIVVGLLVLGVLFGFVWPTFAEYLLCQAGLALGVLVVVLLWGLQALTQFFGVIRKHCQARPKTETVSVQGSAAAPQPPTEGGTDHV